ncbi:hypothetical protein NX059_002151 [Plenodomus lindquistii]|nr:hypothetical protein NX059_002151 [Plenodomus lindquistii]
MLPKQREMDDMVRTIYQAIENEDHLSNTLFVLCGDHGMNDGGNHGGSSPGETSPALVFMSPKLGKVGKSRALESPIKPKNEGEFEYYEMVEQSDIAPTLAGLMGFPVPRNNLGVMLEGPLGLWSSSTDQVRLLHQNAKQMKKIVEATYSSLRFDDKVLSKGEMGVDCSGGDALSLSDGQELACLWQRVVASASDEKVAVEHTYRFMRKAQDTMSGAASNYNVSYLLLGTILSAVICGLSFFTLPSFFPLTSSGHYTALTILLYGILTFASSYVEEEHNFWYWATSGWLGLLFISTMRKDWYNAWMFHPALMTLAIHRLVRRWNQTGQKYAGADDVVNSGIFHGHNSWILWVLVGTTYIHIANRLAEHVSRSLGSFEAQSRPRRGQRKSAAVDPEAIDQNRVVGTMAVMPLCGTAFIFKLAFTAKDAPELTQGLPTSLIDWVDTANLIGLAQMVFGGIALSGIWLGWAEWQRAKSRGKNSKGNGDFAMTLFDLTTLFLLTQTKAHNIPLFLLFRCQFFFLSTLSLSPTAVTLTTLLLTQTSFFALGNTNAISSIDLSNAYNGISSYSIPLVSLLVFLSNWAGPVYWSFAGLLLLGGHGSTQRHIDTSELHVADWVVKEREFLNELARKENKRSEVRGRGEEWVRHVALMTFWTGCMLGSVMAACMVLRQHLFIWTVFSPKYLYAMAWGTAMHLGITVGVGRVVWWVGGW